MSNDTDTITKSPARIQFLTDVLITAVEGGIGYWSYGEEYRHAPERPAEDRGLTITEMGDMDADDLAELGVTLPYRVTLDTIATGIARVAAGEAGVNDDYVSTAIIANIPGKEELVDYIIDADLADIFVQAGIFGKVIYG